MFSSHDGKSYPVNSVDANMTTTTSTNTITAASGGTGGGGGSGSQFATLLFPLRPGEALPMTSWSGNGRVLSIKTASGCTDTLTMAKPLKGELFERVEVTRSQQ